MKKRIFTSLFFGLLFHGVILANPASIDDIRQYSNLTASTTVIAPGGSFSVSVNIANYGSSNFSGSLTAVVFSMPSEQAVDIMEIQSISLSPTTYTTCTFNTSGIPDMTSGSYLVQIFHLPAEEEGEWVVLAANGHTNYVIITVTDPYEVNNTASQAYNLPVSFSNNTATVQTTGSIFHNSTDIDYYKIVLPAGYNYALSGRLHDSHNSTAGIFTVDAKVACSLNGSSWTSDYDTHITGTSGGILDIAGGSTVYFRVQPYFSGNTGSYLLDLNITRSVHNIRLNSNATASPAIIPSGGPFSVSVDIANYGDNNFNGLLAAIIFNDSGELVDTMAVGFTSLEAEYANSYTFNTQGIANMTAGRYTVEIFYRPAGYDEWFPVIAGAYAFATITAIAADPYEVNNTVSQAYLLPVPSSDNVLIVETPGSNFHSNTDIDYYKIVLPNNGYNYTISGYLFDSYTSSTYTVNAKVAYSTNGGSSWSVDYDIDITGTSVLGGDTVCFRVQPSSSGAMGTYLLAIAMIRESLTPDRYEANNTGGEAYQLPVSFSGRTATVRTYGSNIHNDADMDYYKIALPAGNNYTVSGQLHDANNSLFTLDAKVAWSIDNGNSWSEYQDTYIVANGGNLTIINGGEVLFRVRANNDGATGTYMLEIDVLQTTGIAEATKEHSLMVYPNPAKDYVVLDFSKLQIPVTHITVSDAQGRILTNTAVNSPSQITVAVKGWATGLYFIQCQTGEGVITRKFMVK